MSASSCSAAISTSSLFSSRARSISSAGISSSSRWPSWSLKRYIFISSTSTKALNSGPWLTGYCTMTGFTREAALIDSNVASKLAFSASSWLMTPMTGLFSSRA